MTTDRSAADNGDQLAPMYSPTDDEFSASEATFI